MSIRGVCVCVCVVTGHRELVKTCQSQCNRKHKQTQFLMGARPWFICLITMSETKINFPAGIDNCVCVCVCGFLFRNMSVWIKNDNWTGFVTLGLWFLWLVHLSELSTSWYKTLIPDFWKQPRGFYVRLSSSIKCWKSLLELLLARKIKSKVGDCFLPSKWICLQVKTWLLGFHQAHLQLKNFSNLNRP